MRKGGLGASEGPEVGQQGRKETHYRASFLGRQVGVVIYGDICVFRKKKRSKTSSIRVGQVCYSTKIIIPRKRVWSTLDRRMTGVMVQLPNARQRAQPGPAHWGNWGNSKKLFVSRSSFAVRRRGRRRVRVQPAATLALITA